MALDLLVPGLSAIRASLSVLITIIIGVIASQTNLLSSDASKDISRVCVKLFLPCLLISNLGSELQLETVTRYVPILVWALVYNIFGLYVARAAVVLFKLPNWTVPATAFNNTTSLPLLLIQSLKATGMLFKLVGSDGGDDAYDRARSYFLLCAVVSHALTFGKGPETLNGFDEDAPPYQAIAGLRNKAADLLGSSSDSGSSSDEENARGGDDEERQQSHAGSQDDSDEEEANNTTPLLPGKVVRWERSAYRKASYQLRRFWHRLPGPVQTFLGFFAPFINAPTIGAMIGITIGLAPPLQSAFFSDPNEGGFFNGWITTSLRNTGELFVTLQVVIVGVKLSHALRQMKDGKKAGNVPWRAIVFVTSMRFIILPAISIPIIWLIASRTGVLSNDPILWFTMMLMPVGPSAMKLLAMTEVADVEEDTKMAIARFLTIQYGVTPLISLSVVGALKAAEAIKN